MHESVVHGVLQDIPVLLALLVPLAKLRKLAPHEIQLLARVRVHVHIKRPRLRELIVVIAVHLLNNGSLAVYVLVVGKREYVLLAVVVHHRECQLVVVVHALVRRGAEVVERVVHPAHVPLVVEAETAFVHRLCYHRVIRGILRAEYRGRIDPLQPAVQRFQELHAAHVLTAGRVAHVVDNAADSVHAKPVEVVFRQPVVRRRLQEAAHRTLREIEVAASPLAERDVLELRLVGRSAVELSQRVAVHRKMHRNVVHQHCNTVLVAGVHQLFQTLGGSIAGGRREESGRLIAPAFVAGVLVQRHKLDAVVAVLLAVLHELRRDVLVFVPAVGVAGIRAPASEVDLVDVQRVAVPGVALLHPVEVVKVETHVAYYGSEFRAQLHAEAHRVAVLNAVPAVVNLVFVHLPRSCVGYAYLPEFAVAGTVEVPVLPAVEVADDRHAFRIGRINSERSAEAVELRTEPFVDVKAVAGAEIT